MLFSRAGSLLELTVARGLFGLGVASSLMAAIKANSLWLALERLPISTAVLLSVGGMGGAFFGLAMGTLLVSLLLVALVPQQPRRQETRLADMARCRWPSALASSVRPRP